MANITEYLEWRGDIPLRISPFNEVDNLVLSQLAYLNLDDIYKKNITITDAIKGYFEKYDKKGIKSQFPLSSDPIPFYKNLQKSKRFGKLKIIKYINQVSKEEEKQFSVMIIKLNYNTVYVAFKGTDNNLVGWKEDFNMSYMDTVPSQIAAVNFVNKNISFIYRNIYLGGHSKGGNLAVYAAIECKKRIQKRIKKIYNNDGPGFLDQFVKSKTYLKMIPKITTILPETSIFGMLLTHKEKYKVVKSSEVGIWQHDALSWQVMQNHFVTLKKVNETSDKIRITITDWLNNIDNNRRESFINNLFDILEKNKIETVEDLTKLKLRKIPGLLREFNKMDEQNRKMMMELLRELMKEANKNFNRRTILKGLKLMNHK